jgi:hypothetical protein
MSDNGRVWANDTIGTFRQTLEGLSCKVEILDVGARSSDRG